MRYHRAPSIFAVIQLLLCILLFLWRECCHALKRRWRMAAAYVCHGGCSWQAELISTAACYECDYRWRHQQLIKEGTLKKTEELRSWDISVSFHQATPPPPATTVSPSQTTAPSVASLFFPLHHRFRAVRRGMWHHKNSPEVSWLVTSTAACLVSGFPQGKLWSGPCLCTSRLLKGKRKKIFNRMFLHLVNWQNSFLEPCLGKQICGRVSDWQWGEFGMWKQDELLSLDKVSELQHCFAWDSRKASKVWSRNKHAGLSV